MLLLSLNSFLLTDGAQDGCDFLFLPGKLFCDYCIRSLSLINPSVRIPVSTSILLFEKIYASQLQFPLTTSIQLLLPLLHRHF